MRICQLCAVDFTLKTFLLPLVDAQLDQGHEVVCVCSKGRFTDGLRDAGYTVESISISRSFNVIEHLKSICQLYKFLKATRFDVIHVHTPIAAMIGRSAAFLAGVPLVIYTAHGFYFHENMSFCRKYLYIFLEFVFGLITDILFTQCEEDAENAVKFKIMSKENVYVIGNGVNVERFNPIGINYTNKLRESLGIPDDAFVIGMICRLVKEKGVAEFLQAAKGIYTKVKNCHFLLIGERQPHDHAEGVEDAINSAKGIVKGNLILTGYRSDIPELLDIMDLYVLPSWREGMPLSIIEAMMMKLPVLATDIRGSREEVIHNKTGVLVPVKSPDFLKDAMLKFLENPGWGQKLGLAGRQRALEHYDERKVVKLQLDIIDKYCRKRDQQKL